MRTRMHQRVEALETKMKVAGCPECRDWPKFAVVFESRGDKVPEQVCPKCGRDATRVIQVIRITERPDGPK